MPPSGQPRTVCMPENMTLVCEAFSVQTLKLSLMDTYALYSRQFPLRLIEVRNKIQKFT